MSGSWISLTAPLALAHDSGAGVTTGVVNLATPLTMAHVPGAAVDVSGTAAVAMDNNFPAVPAISGAEWKAALDASVYRMLKQLNNIGELEGTPFGTMAAGCNGTTIACHQYIPASPTLADYQAAHFATAQALAEESATLLRNDDALLPLVPADYSGANRLLVMGASAFQTYTGGGGSAHVTPIAGQVPTAYDSLVAALPGANIDYALGYAPSSSVGGFNVPSQGGSASHAASGAYPASGIDAGAGFLREQTLDGLVVPAGAAATHCTVGDPGCAPDQADASIAYSSLSAATTLPVGSAWRWTGQVTAPPAGGPWQLRVCYGFVGANSSDGSIQLYASDSALPADPASANRVINVTSASATNLDGGSFTGQCHNPGYSQQNASASGAGTNIADGAVRNIELRAVANGTQPLRLYLQWAPTSSSNYQAAAIADAVAQASMPGTTPVMFVYDDGSEGSDRGGNNAAAGMVLPGYQDAAVQAVVDANPNTIVVVMTGDPVYMPWALSQPGHNAVKSILEMWYPGQRGGIATVNVLLGTVNPGGKLPETFPVDDTHFPQYEATCDYGQLGQSSSASNVGTCSLYPGVYMPGFLRTASSGTLHNYRTINFSNSTLTDTGVSANPDLTYIDTTGLAIPATVGNGIFTGYRWYDWAGVDPLFEFGHGLSYTTFGYSNLAIGPGTGGAAVDVSFDLTNTGSVAGDETPQIYVGSPASPPVPMAVRALGAFERISLDPGETQHVTLQLADRPFEYWNTTAANFANNDIDGWATAAGCRTISVGSSSRDIRLAGAADETGAGDCASVTTVAADFNPSQVGHPVTFTATVMGDQPDPAAASGTVQFSLDGSPVGGPVALDAAGQATLGPITDLGLGTHTIGAAYSGNGDFAPSSGSVDQTVKKRLGTSTAVTSDLNPSTYGTLVTYTATVSPENTGSGLTPSGWIQWKVDGVAVGAPVALDASAQATMASNSLSTGHRGIRALYLADPNFTGSTSPTYVQTVRKAAPTGTVSSAPASPITFGTKPTFTATFVNPVAPMGSLTPADVQFLIDGTNLGAPVMLAADGTATFPVTWNLPLGNHMIKARYLGSADFVAVLSSGYALKINP